MSNPYRDKLLGIGVISRRTRPVVTEGRTHPETGVAFKRVEDEGSIVTEHATRNDRVDAVVKAATVHARIEHTKEAGSGR
jgi:hypothetical protein